MAELCRELTSLRYSVIEVAVSARLFFALTTIFGPKILGKPKEDPIPELSGKSPRNLARDLIAWAREISGVSNVIAEAVIGDERPDFIIADVGFQREVDEYAKKFGKENVLLITLEREGCSFEGDTRNRVRNLNTSHIVDNYAGELAREVFAVVWRHFSLPSGRKRA
jgi:hypothetical protein